MRLHLSGWALQTSRLQSCARGRILDVAAFGVPRISALLGPSVLQQVDVVSSKHIRASMQARSAVSELFAASMPKAEIGAQDFLQEHPEFDGRGVLVAIFDTGVDPGTQGLQVTSDGKPKILDVLDCTGSGDVNMTKETKAIDGTVKGVYGNDLKLNPEWTNPTGEWHVGTKRAFELFPSPLKTRMTKHRKRFWDQQQQAALAEAASKLAAFEKAHTPCPNELKQEAKLAREELEAKCTLLKESAEGLEDQGPTLDCVAWHDGQHYRVAIDTSDMYPEDPSKGRLADFHPLTDFDVEHEYGTFSAADACNFGVHFYPQGEAEEWRLVLSIVVDAGSHGTHVAGIATACHPDNPAMNGCAPGAQIISCKIGDSRLDSMETIVGLARGLAAVLNHKADLINLSYGEETALPNRGRFIQLANEAVNKHGVIFISSAGNAGPALSTVGAPGGSTSSIISIGAYVSPAMASASHSVRGTMSEGQQYTWSSRGPTYDGYMGVSLSAPGGAIAPVPQWTQQARQLMNGTSMSSPNACGGAALLLSGLKASSIAYTPTSVRRALENTCLPVGPGEPAAALTYGCGLMQVHKAFKYMQKMAAAEVVDTRYNVRVKRAGSTEWQRGVYLRNPLDTAAAPSFTVEVMPQLHEDADVKTERLAVEDYMVLQSTAPWLDCPSQLIVPHNGRTFELKVDPSKLTSELNFGQILGMDSSMEDRGPLFRVPVTVIRPGSPEPSSSPQNSAGLPGPAHLQDLGSISFSPGTEVRRFLSVLEGATWAEMTITAGPMHDSPRTFMLRATQLQPHMRHGLTEHRGMLQLAAGEQSVQRFKVRPGLTLEVTLAQFWNSLGSSQLSVQVQYHGLEAKFPSGAALLDGSANALKCLLRSPFRAETILPQAKLTTVQMPLRPVDAVMASHPAPRDRLTTDRVPLTLHLTYKFTLTEAGKVTPKLPLLNNHVYEGEMEAQMYMIFDANKRLLATGDTKPATTQLGKGDYVIRLVLRHDSPAILEKMKSLPMVLERQLGEPVSVPCYGDVRQATRKASPLKERSLGTGEQAAFYVSNAPEEKLPKDATAGRLMTGTLSIAKLPKSGGAAHAPGPIPFTFVVPPKPESPPKVDEPEAEPVPSPAEKLKAAVRDAQIKAMGALKSDPPSGEEQALYEETYAQLAKEWPDHVPLLTQRMQRMSSAKQVKEADEAAEDVIKAVVKEECSRLGIQQASGASASSAASALPLGAFLNPKPLEDIQHGNVKKALDGKKAALVEALQTRLRLRVSPAEATSPDTGSQPEAAEGSKDGAEASSGPEVQALYSELRRWVDNKNEDPQQALLVANIETSRGRHAVAIRVLNAAMKAADKPASKEMLELRQRLWGLLGCQHWQRHEQARIRNYFPPAYPEL